MYRLLNLEKSFKADFPALKLFEQHTVAHTRRLLILFALLFFYLEYGYAMRRKGVFKSICV